MQNEEMDAATPAEQVTAEVGDEVEQQATPEATTEQPEQHNEEDQPKKEPWFQKRIGELTRQKYETLREAEQARQEAAQLREQLARIQQGEQPEQRQPDVMTLAEQIAAQRLAERELVSATDRVWNAGTKELDGFEQSVNNLAMVGMDANFVRLAIEGEQAHKVLHYLGQEAHLDEAARILRLPPVQQARELTKLELKLSQPPAPKPVSKAPEPIKPIGTGNVSDSDLRDDLPIEEWMRRDRERTRRK